MTRKLPKFMCYERNRYWFVKTKGSPQKRNRLVKRVLLGKTRSEAQDIYDIIIGQMKGAKLAHEDVMKIAAFRKPDADDTIRFADACRIAGITFSNLPGGVNPWVIKHFEDTRLIDFDENEINKFIVLLLNEKCSDSYIEKILWSGVNKTLRTITRMRNMKNIMQEMLDRREPKQKMRVWWNSEANKMLAAARKERDEFAEKRGHRTQRKRVEVYLSRDQIFFMLRKAKEFGDIVKYGNHRLSNLHRDKTYGNELVLFLLMLFYSVQRFTAVRKVTFSLTSDNHIDFVKNRMVLKDNKNGTVKVRINSKLRQGLLLRYEEQKAKYANEKVVPIFDNLPKGTSKMLRRFFDWLGGEWASIEPYGSIKGSALTDVVIASNGQVKTASAAIGITPVVMSNSYELDTGDNPVMKLDYGTLEEHCGMNDINRNMAVSEEL